MDLLLQASYLDAVPVGGSVTCTEIAKKLGNCDEGEVRRTLRSAFDMRYFELAPGSNDTVVHASLSLALIRQPSPRD
jgi:hypothetical protein